MWKLFSAIDALFSHIEQEKIMSLEIIMLPYLRWLSFWLSLLTRRGAYLTKKI